MDFILTIIDIISKFGEYALGFISYLVEGASGLLSSGNIIMFVLIILLVWKLAIKLKG